MPSKRSVAWVQADSSQTKGRVHLAQTFRHQLAKDDGQESDDHDHQRGGGDVHRAVAEQREHPVQQVCQRLRESRIADDAVEHPNRRDADLHRRQPFGRVVVQHLRGCRAGLARFDHHRQPGLA